MRSTPPGNAHLPLCGVSARRPSSTARRPSITVRTTSSIRVNGIAPGAIRTPINRAAWETREALDKLLELIPYRRIGEPEDIARAAVWLASDDSDYITGTTLFVDGGMTLYPGFEDNG